MSKLSERIAEFNRGIPENLRAMKYALMRKSAFSFYRGSCHLFYEDNSPGNLQREFPSVWSCGDLHLENFGSYRGANRLVYFDVNDFDESALMPAWYDLARAVVSIRLAADKLSLPHSEAIALCTVYISEYFGALKSGKATDIEKECATGLLKKFLCSVEERTQGDFLNSRAKMRGHRSKIRCDGKKALALEPETRENVLKAVNTWIKDYGG